MDYAERYDRWQTLPQVFFEKAAECGDTPLFWAKRYDSWQSSSWAQARDDVLALARGLRAAGVERGDRVLLVSENRPEWGIADIAIMALGAITVPAYTTNTVGDHVHLISDCDPRAAIVSSDRLAERLLPAIRQTGNVRTMVTIEGSGGTSDAIDIVNWRDMIRDGSAMDGDIEAELASLSRTDTACLIYTSGTGGAPKGVMLSHGAILCNCTGAYHLFEDAQMLELDNEAFLSFLPLSHSYEHTAGLHFPISIGAEIYYAESVDKLAANMGEVHPTIMTAVPRLYESMHQRIVAGIERKGGLSEKLFKKAVELGIKRYEQGPEGLSFVERIQDKMLDKLVRKKVAGRFGGRLKAFVSGGAPLNYDIGVFFLALGVRLLQGYGQTETAPVVSANPPRRIKIDTVGPAFPGVDLRIADDGEILIRGELTMQGYWNAPDLTAEALKDGWVHTGDIGTLDEDGYIKITDRKKDIIVNSGGDNVSPQRVEGALVFEPEIGQAMVYGDKRPHLVAVLVPEDGFMAEWARENGRDNDLAALSDSEKFHERLREAIERANERLSPIEQVRRFLVAEEAFTTDNGLMTPSLKIRRHEIRKIYGERLEALYGRRR
ncbi:MAG: long-chain fatty acid--CoA ligase [Alphaproteobacteria bacterium]|nr:long-chain fatty acid--CoA ligase [Alphaproteobacteria bacterium]